MLNIPLRARRTILAGGFVLAVGIAPLVGLFPGPDLANGSPADCPAGKKRDPLTNVCVTGIAPPGSIGAPTYEALTKCNGSRRSACTQARKYGNFTNLAGW